MNSILTKYEKPQRAIKPNHLYWRSACCSRWHWSLVRAIQQSPVDFVMVSVCWSLSGLSKRASINAINTRFSELSLLLPWSQPEKSMVSHTWCGLVWNPPMERNFSKDSDYISLWTRVRIHRRHLRTSHHCFINVIIGIFCHSHNKQNKCRIKKEIWGASIK